MSTGSPPPDELDNLPPAGIERRMQEHLSGMWAELHAAGEELRSQYHLLNLAARHPFAAAVIAGAAAAFGIRALKRAAAPPAPPAPAAPESLRRGLARSLLSGLASAAGRVLPALAAACAARSSRSGQQPS
jgi:hypothetical protein